MKNKPIRILHVLAGLNRAGAETMIMNIYRNIDRKEIQFDFAISNKNKCDYEDEILKMGGRIIRYPKYKGYNHIKYVKWWNTFLRTNKEYKVIHGHIGSTAAIYLKIAKKYGLYTIAHSHNAPKTINLHAALYKIYSFPTRYIADYFFGCSEAALKSRYGNRVAKNEEISKILCNGIRISDYEYSETIRQKKLREIGLDKNSIIIGTIGRIVDQKNPLFIIKIMKELASIDQKFILLWIGEGNLENKVKKEIKKNSLKNIKMLGKRSDIADLMQIFNVFILPSKYEGLPVVGIEAQAAGMPLICSDSISDEIKISRHCVTLPIKSAKQWTKEIIKYRTYKRDTKAASDLSKKGYDISSTSYWMTVFYKQKYSTVNKAKQINV